MGSPLGPDPEMKAFYVKAVWDGEAHVFYSETNIPGLTIEAPTLAEFQQLIVSFAPEMLAENVGIRGDIKVHFSVEHDLSLAVA